MARKKLPEEYTAPIDLERIAESARAGEMPVATALGMLYRSTKLPQEVIDSIAADALAGYEWDAIAARAGMAPKTLGRYLRRGLDRREKIDEWFDRRRELPEDATDEQIIAEIGEPPVEDDLLALYDAVSRAFANAECRLVDVIRTAAELGSTADAKWLLTARFPNWKGSNKLPRMSDVDTDAADRTGSFDQLNAKIVAFAQRLGPAKADPPNERGTADPRPA